MAPRKKPYSRPYGTAFTQTSETLTESTRLLAKAVVDDFNALTPDYKGPLTQGWKELSKQLYGVEMPLEGVLYYYAKVQNRPTPKDRADAVRELRSYDIERMMREDGVSARFGIYADNFDAFMRMSSGDRRERVQEILSLRKEKNDVFGGALSGAGAIKPPPFPRAVLIAKQQWDDKINRIEAARAQAGLPRLWNYAQIQFQANETADQVAMNSFDPTPPDGYVLNLSATQQKAFNDFVNAQQEAINRQLAQQAYVPYTAVPNNQPNVSPYQIPQSVITAWESALKTDFQSNYTYFLTTPMYTNLPPILREMLDDAVEQRLRGNQPRLAPDAEPATVGRRIELEFI